MHGRKPTILLSARDPRAAEGINTLAHALIRSQPEYDIRIVAQQPAFEILNCSKYLLDNARLVPFEPDDIPEVEGGDYTGLLSRSASIIKANNPNILIASLSGPGIGIDEGLLAAAPEELPTITIQDEPGWVVDGIAGSAKTYICKTTDAVAQTKNRSRVKRTFSVGDWSPPIPCQSSSRAKTDKVIFFGQPLWMLPGYASTLKHVGRGFSKHHKTILYQPHPKENREDQRRAARLLNGKVSSFEFDEALTRAKIHLSCYSSSLFDVMRLNPFDATKVRRISCLWSPDIRRFYAENSDGLLLSSRKKSEVLVATRAPDLERLQTGSIRLHAVPGKKSDWKSSTNRIVSIVAQILGTNRS